MNLLDEARELINWFRSPSGYAEAEEIKPKIDRMVDILAALTEKPNMALRSENCQLHIENAHLRARLEREGIK